MKIRLKRKQILMLVGLAIIILAIPLTVYLAQRSQNIRSEAARSGGETLTATLAVTPNPASPSSSVRVSGTGYSNTTWVEIRQVDSNGQVVAAYTAWVWADGHIDFSFITAAQTGNFTLNAYQKLKKGKRASPTLVAQTSLVVQ